ncbi:MAG: extracellular solute-binding protein [Candidatus Eremiobacteraeota bacterium]|nr:extracellular solute-binding protein [Candidatus Eremiobacteraeota bacterium]
MNWKLAIAGTLAGALFCAAQSAFADDVVIKVWSRADRSGPLRAGNIVSAGDTMNKMLTAAGSDKRVKIELNETNAKGYDDDALDLLKAFAVDKGPDIFVLAHEWTGAFAEAGYAMNLEDHIGKNPELYGDIIGPLWQSVTYKGARYGVPQDSEVRMFFLNNDKLRKLGRSDKDIAALPAKVEAGEFTEYDLCDLAGQAVQKGVVKYGILHRPNAGPDFQMLTETFGLESYDKAAAKLQISKAALKDFYTWVKYCVDKKALSPTNTAMSWDAIEQAAMGGEESLVFFHGVWRVTDQMKALKLGGKDDYLKKYTWINAPAGKKGGKPANLSHPIVYAVSAKSKNKELAAYIVALASQPVPNTRHAVTTNHTPINYGQQSMPEVVEKGWALVAATPMLKYASFMPNHPKIGQYNSIIFKGIQGIETGRLNAQAATDFVVGEMENELGKDVVIRN